MTDQTDHDPFRSEEDGQRQAPTDVGDAFDPFRASNPAVLVHDVDAETFERAWRDRDTQCPQCRRGTPDERGTAALDQRSWVRFTCGDVIAVEHTAG